MVSCYFSSPHPVKQLLCHFVPLQIRQLLQGLEYIFSSDCFWSLCQTLDEVGRGRAVLVAWSGGRCMDVPTGASAAQGSSYWSRGNRERERGDPTKNKNRNSACLLVSAIWGHTGWILSTKGAANLFWSAARKARPLSCLTFCYHRFLGRLKETVLRLALNAVRGPFCLQIAN